MKQLFKKIIFLFVLLMPLAIIAQDAPKDKAPATSRAQRKAAKQKWKEQRRVDMANKKVVKQHHKRIQTKKTRKEMRKEKKKSEKLRANKREFFLVRWFRFRKH